ncbi:hypothetical protein ACFIOY_21380 [Bradyrhizobium sp. TZ2]
MAKTEVTKQRHHLDRRADRLADEGEKGAADELLSSCQVAHWLGVSENWMSSGRIRNYGPPITQPFPEVIRYRRRDVVKWLRARASVCVDQRIRLNETPKQKWRRT